MIKNTSLVPIILCIGGTATAQPSFDCSKASGTVEELICEDAELAALDRRLSATYQMAVEVVQNLDAGADEALSNLRAFQRGWIKGRDDCWKADDLRSCVEGTYLDREGALVAEWMLQEPVAIVSYTCGGTPANEVTAFYFDTELPSIRVEYGDGIKFGSQRPAASGSRYGLGFGASFWSKGDEVLFEWVEGDEQSCVSGA